MKAKADPPPLAKDDNKKAKTKAKAKARTKVKAKSKAESKDEDERKMRGFFASLRMTSIREML